MLLKQDFAALPQTECPVAVDRTKGRLDLNTQPY